MTKWYVLKTAPGASRPAPHRLCISADRREETIAERAIRDAGLVAYCPAMRKDVIHHRTKKLITKRIPLMTGYLFAGFQSANPNFHTIATLREISSILGTNGRPYCISQTEISRYQAAEADMQFDDTREARLHRREIGRTARLTLAMEYPAGTRVSLDGGPFAGFAADVVSVTGRNTIRAMIRMFEQLVEIEVPIDNLAKVA